MNTKEKVKHWLTIHPELKDNDNRLCANIWSKEIDAKYNLFTIKAVDFLRMYANNELTSAPSIKRARAKLQEEDPKYRGKKYHLRKGTFQDEWRKKLGYEVSK